MSFNYGAFLAAPQPNTPLEIFQGQLVAAAKAQNLCDTVDALLTQRSIVAENFTLLPAEHPSAHVSPLMNFTSVPNNMRVGVTYALNGGSYATSLPELYGHHVTLRYVGHSASDQSAITAAGAIVNLTTPYTVTVDGSLRVDGTEVARFPGDNPGTPESLGVTISLPNAPTTLSLSHAITSGGVYALKVSPDRTPDSSVTDAAHAVGVAVANAASQDDADEARATQALELFTNEVETESARVFGLEGYVQSQAALEGVAGRYVDATFSFGLPVSLHRSNYQIDVHDEAFTPVGLDGDTAQGSALNKLAGYQGSTREYLIWEQILHRPAISSVKALQGAASDTDPVLTLTTASQVSQLQGYSADTTQAVSDAINAGETVTITQRPVDYLQYHSVEAYIALNTSTGEGTYALGLLGSTMHPMLNGGGDDGTGTDTDPGGGCACCAAGTCGSGGSTIQYSNGDHYVSETDVTLPNPGLPLTFGRTYRSRSGRTTPLGTDWMHTYGMFLDIGSSTVTYVNEELREIPFTSNGDGTFTLAAPQWHETLTFDGSTYRLRFRDGLVYAFDTAGKLTSELDLNGNAITLAYISGLLHSVTGNGGNAFTLAYDGTGQLQTVTDSAGRVVTYHHTGSDLVAADDVLNKTQSYAYDSQHELTAEIDKNGNSKTELYNADGRWIGSVDALGGAISVVYDDQHAQAAVTDKNGNSTLYAWNADGNPTSMTDAQGNTSTTEWSADGAMNKQSMTDGTGSTWLYQQYDANGNARRTQDPLGNSSTYTYELAHNRMTSETLPEVGSSSFQYDTHGNLLQATNANNETTVYTYQSNGLPSTITQQGAGATPDATTALVFEAHGSLQKITDPEDGGTTLGFDAAGHLTSIQDPVGNTRSMQVDARGQVSSMTDGENHTSRMFYDDLGNRTLSLDATDGGTSFAYDALERNIAVTDTQGHTATTEYDAMGNVASRVDMNGNRTTYKYDALNRAIETKNADGSVMAMGYCGQRASRPCTMVDALGNVTTMTEDKLGRDTKTLDALGNSTQQTFDGAGRVSASADANSNSTSYQFDNANRVTAVFSPLSNVQYTYDPRGNRLTVINFQGSQTTRFTYDKANRLKSETTPAAFNGVPITTSYSYDAAGSRATKVDALGLTTSYVYDHDRRLTNVNFQDGSHYDFAFDARGNRTLEKHVGVGGTVIHERDLSYNELNRLSLVNDVTMGRDLAYSYDASGNRASLTVSVQATGIVEAGYVYKYDSQNRLSEVDDQDGDTTRLTYDAAGNRSSLTYGNGMVARYTYDADNRLVDITYTAATGAVLQRFKYQLDAVGNRLSKTFADGSAEVYGYDGNNRLTHVTMSASSTTYALNGFSQIASVTRLLASGTETTTNTLNSFNQLSEAVSSSGAGTTTTDYSYDGNGNLTTSAPDSGPSTSYHYDQDNRMVEVDLPAGLVDTFKYDANGIRTQKNDSAGTTNYLLDGPSVVTEYDATESIKAEHSNNPQRIDEQFSMTQTGVKYWPVSDALGSVYEWVARDASVGAAYSYDVYGTRTQASGGLSPAWGYTGREQDADVGTLYLRDRPYLPGAGAFLQRDRLGVGHGPNLYAYVTDNPVGNVDPTGESLVERTGGPGRTLYDEADNWLDKETPDPRIDDILNSLETHGYSFDVWIILAAEISIGTIRQKSSTSIGRMGLTLYNFYCPQGHLAEGQIVSVIDVNDIKSVNSEYKAMSSSKYAFEEEVAAHELGHAFMDAILGSAAGSPSLAGNNGYTPSDDMACEEGRKAHLAMYGDDLVRGEETYIGCTERTVH